MIIKTASVKDGTGAKPPASKLDHTIHAPIVNGQAADPSHLARESTHRIHTMRRASEIGGRQLGAAFQASEQGDDYVVLCVDALDQVLVGGARADQGQSRP